MRDFFSVTLIAQSCSAALIGALLLYFAKIYQRKYLYYWAYSFLCLMLFLLGAYFAVFMLAQNYDPSSVLRMGNLFVMSTFGYLQIGFLVIGTLSFVNNTSINKKTLIRIFIACLMISLLITFFKNWSEADSQLRYFVRVGLRYLIAGIACIGTAIYILKNDPKPLIGKQLVTIGFFTYGFEMTFLGWLTAENYIFGSSLLLSVMASYHGLFELLLYPMIGASLVVWLLEVERQRGLQVMEKLQHLNHTDGLSGLPNSAALNKHLSDWSRFAKQQEKITLALFGIDQMQRINDGDGIKTGDQLLSLFAKRLEFLSTGFRFHGRLHGDVFVVILGGYGKEQQSRVETLRKSLSRPFKLKSKTYHLEVSSGATKAEPNMANEQVLLRANQALQSAKANGGKQSKIYRKGIKLKGHTDLLFENELRTAFKQKQFEIYYQPIWSDKNTIICFEALIRWNHPTKGVLAPNSFLYLVQQLGLMVELDFWVTEQAIKQVKIWRKTNLDAAKVTINLSADTIQNSQIVEHIKACSLKHRVTTQNITIEITENTAMHNVESGKSTLNELRKLNIQIAIDDFGTGYSSLNYLRTFPSDVIKFDRSFVSDTSNQLINQEILKALIPLCHQLGKKVIVEGIENRSQYDQLNHHQVDGYQGYYLCYPVTEQEASKMLQISKKSFIKKTMKAH